MTDQFRDAAIRELHELLPLASYEQLLKIASIMWELIPKIYNEGTNEQKHIK